VFFTSHTSRTISICILGQKWEAGYGWSDQLLTGPTLAHVRLRDLRLWMESGGNCSSHMVDRYLLVGRYLWVGEVVSLVAMIFGGKEAL
jgi:hypothetical protein